MQWLIDFIKILFKKSMPPLQDTPPPTPKEYVPAYDLYNTAKSLLGRHLTLNSNVPPDLGCAEAVSTVLLKAGVPGVPAQGFPGTKEFNEWLSTNPLFEQTTYEKGAVIISPTGAPGSQFAHGHIGICGAFGIMSNNSSNGLFQEGLSYDFWKDFYGIRGSFPILFYRVVDKAVDIKN